MPSVLDAAHDPDRELYRALREAEDQAAQEKWNSDWHAANPDQRSARRKVVDRLLRKKPVAPPPMDTRPLSAPPYQPSELQVQNMERLQELILEELHEPYGPDMLEVAELYRELGRFEEALVTLEKCPAVDIGEQERLMERLINEGPKERRSVTAVRLVEPHRQKSN